jgi:hypothetical protein
VCCLDSVLGFSENLEVGFDFYSVLGFSENLEVGFDFFFSDSFLSREDHALGRYCSVIGRLCVVVKNGSGESHLSDEIVGDSLEENCTDIHVPTASS